MPVVSDIGDPQKRSKVGLFLLGVTGGAAFVLSLISLPFILPALRRICLPFVPATPAQMHNLLRALHGRSGRLIDLGSGDGRVVIMCARLGFHSLGVELNPVLVAYSKLQAYSAGVSDRAKFRCADLWTVRLRNYNNVVIFGVEEMMPSLERKLKKELTDFTCVVACRFPFPNWTPDATFGRGLDTVWLYRNPVRRGRRV